jgi:hypothetical protein
VPELIHCLYATSIGQGGLSLPSLLVFKKIQDSHPILVIERYFPVPGCVKCGSTHVVHVNPFSVPNALIVWTRRNNYSLLANRVIITVFCDVVPCGPVEVKGPTKTMEAEGVSYTSERLPDRMA